MRVDFQREDENSGSAIYPEGNYTVKILDNERTVASTGNPQIKWSGEIQSGQFKGKRITDFTPLTEKGVWRTVKLIKAAIGLKSFKALGIMDTESPEFNALLRKCNGRSMTWVVFHDEYNNKIRAKIADYLPLDIEEELTMPLEDVPEFLKSHEDDRDPGQEG